MKNFKNDDEDNNVLIKEDGLIYILGMSKREKKIYFISLVRRNRKTNLVFLDHDTTETTMNIFTRTVNNLIKKGVLTKTDKKNTYMLSPVYGIYCKPEETKINKKHFLVLMLDFLSYRASNKKYRDIKDKELKKRITEETLYELAKMDS